MKRNWQLVRLMDLKLTCRKSPWTRSMLRELAYLQIDLFRHLLRLRQTGDGRNRQREPGVRVRVPR